VASRNQQDFRREDESEEDADSEAPSPSLVAGREPTISEAQRVYLDSNNSKKQLYLLSFATEIAALEHNEVATPMRRNTTPGT
jgi:hypothetical protein